MRKRSARQHRSKPIMGHSLKQINLLSDQKRIKEDTLLIFKGTVMRRYGRGCGIDLKLIKVK